MFEIPDYRTTIYRSNPFLQNTSGGCFYIYDSRLYNKH